MKKILNGKLYSTDTAVNLGCVASNLADRLNSVRETLYRKKSGEYFLHGEGGPNTRYAVTIDSNSWSGSEKIMPMSYVAAKEWAEKNLTADEYESAFGAVTDDETTVALNTTLSAAANDKLRKMASAEGISIKALLERLIENA